MLARAPQFEEALLGRDVDLAGGAGRAPARHAPAAAGARRRGPRSRALGALARRRARRPATDAGRAVAPLLEPEAEVYAALVLGLRDYVEKNGFEHVVLGLSGGIDSALVALIAVDALGAGARDAASRCRRRYSSDGTQRRRARARREPRRRAARARRSTTAMRGLRRAARRAVRGPRARHHRGEPAGAHPRQPADGAVEQVRLARAHHRQQERDVGRLRDALRRHGRRLRGDQGRAQDARSTGSSTGATQRRGAEPGRRRSSTRPPSAELRPDQRDDDSLPPYDVLDAILEGYVEEDLGREQLDRRGLPARGRRPRDRGWSTAPSTSAARRRPGIKISPRAFGRDRRCRSPTATPRRRPVVL